MSSYLHPKSQTAEAFRTLRTSLHFTANKQVVKVLQITSPSPGDGKTHVAVNLAMSMVQAGEKVLLVDCDLRKPKVHRRLSVPNRRGLTNVLVDSQPLESVIQETGVSGLYALTSGPIPPNPAELLESPQMDAVLRDVKERFDHVIVDCPPAMPLADASILASKVDGTILVLVAGETRIDAAQDVKDALERARGKIIGVVLNKVRYSSKDYRYRYYYYYEDKRDAVEKASE